MVDSISTFQGTSPRRPGTADILNGDKENATPTVPPNAPAAEEFMQMSALLAAYGRMVPLLRISVDYDSGTGLVFVHSFACIRDDVAITDITATHNGVGDVTLTWPAGKFPAALGRPLGGTNRGSSAGRAADAALVTNGVQVHTCDSAGAADLPFTVAVY